jgi:glycosyltransferase involved in cell wall biosynthesis
MNEQAVRLLRPGELGSRTVPRVMRRRIIISAPVSSGGLYTNLRYVLPRLQRIEPTWSFELHSPLAALRAVFGRTDEPWMHVTGVGSMKERLRWEMVDLPALLRSDPDALLFAPFGALLNVRLASRGVVKSENLLTLLPQRELVVTPAEHAKFLIMRRVVVANARRAGTLVCASKHSRARLSVLSGVPEDRMPVIPHGVEPPPAGLACSAPANEALRQKPYLLHVGQAMPYKRSLEMAKAYVELVRRRPDAPPLVWLGAALPIHRAYERQCLEVLRPLLDAGKAHHLGHVPHQDVMALTASAHTIAYPSIIEDCPNVVLEALGAGAVLVCADIPATRELADGQAVMVGESSGSAIADALERALFDEVLRARLKVGARQRAAMFTWDATAQRFADTLRNAFDSLGARSGRETH